MRNWHFLVCFLLAVGLSGCSTARRDGVANSPRSARDGSNLNHEQAVRRYGRYIYPGITLGDANNLMGWKASYRAGNWFWTRSGTLLVQTKLSSSNIDEDPMIVEVYDFLGDIRMRWNEEQEVIEVDKISVLKQGGDGARPASTGRTEENRNPRPDRAPRFPDR